jgi:hypothetical protein
MRPVLAAEFATAKLKRTVVPLPTVLSMSALGKPAQSDLDR